MSRGKYAAARPRAKGPRIGTIVFYLLYLLAIAAFFYFLSPVIDSLNGWLVSYEASQPKVKCQEVFEELFRDPDWAALYTMAGVEDTQFEGKEQFAAYMEQRIGDDALTYSETSAGLSGDKKYIVKHGTEKVATFTLTGSNTDAAQIPEWTLGTVEVFFTRTQHITVRTVPGYTVTVNGVPLDDSHLIRSTSTTAEKYLPEGTHGLRIVELYLDGLLIQPEITVTDETGAAVELHCDPENSFYSQDFTAIPMSESEADVILNAARVYSKYMINAAGKSDLKKCFDADSQIYQTVINSDTWTMQSYLSYEFCDEAITDYYRYSDSCYSAKVTLNLNVTRKNGTVKQYALANTLIFTLSGDGSWLVTDMTNLDLQAQQTLVRLTFVNGGEILSSEMTDAAAGTLALPAVTAPEGQVFTGWFTETVDAEGNKTMTLVFAPDEDGTVILPEDSALEPMTLYALFDTQKAE